MTEAPRPSPQPRPPAQTGPPAGYYADPQGRPEMRWWDGMQWTNVATPMPGTQTAAVSSSQLRIAGGAVAALLGVIGIVMNLQSVSVLSGTSTAWTGAALVVAGAVIGFIPALSHWAVGMVLTLVALAAIANAAYEQHQINQRIDQLNNASTHTTRPAFPHTK